MKYILGLLAVSYALRCLSLAIMNGYSVARHLREQAAKVEHEAQQPHHDAIRRGVEWLWFAAYLLIAYRLVK